MCNCQILNISNFFKIKSICNTIFYINSTICFLIFSIFFYFSSYVLFAESGSESEVHSKSKEVEHNSPILDNIKKLCRNAHNLEEYWEDPASADSLYQLALSSAEATFDDKIILETYILYLKNVYRDSYFDKVQTVMQKTKSVINGVTDETLIFEGYTALSLASIEKYDLQNSLDFTIKLLSNASKMNDIKSKIIAYTLNGKALEINNKNTDAFENYLDAQELIAQLGENEKKKLQFDLDGKLFDFYLKINQLDKAVEYKKRQIEFVSNEQLDSNKIMWLTIDLCNLKTKEDKSANIKPTLEQLINYSEKHEHLRMLNTVLSIYRTLLLNTEDIAGFRDLLVKRFPGNLLAIKKEVPALYYLIQAYLFEDEKKIDSSNYYFLKAEEVVKGMGNDVYASNFYKRYGQYNLRNNNIQRALDNFKLSYEKAKNRDYLDYMLESCEFVEKLSAQLGDFENAYKYGKIKSQLDLRKSQALYEGNMLKLELKSQARQKEIIAEKHEEEKKKLYNLQYTIILVVIFSAFLLLILASSLTVPEWLIEMLGFFSILFLFEFIILLLDTQIHTFTHGAPLKIFLIKIAILSFLFPLHHKIESKITNYMKKNKLIGNFSWTSIKRSFRRIASLIIPQKHLKENINKVIYNEDWVERN